MGLQQRRELFKMAAQPRKLLADVATVGKKRDFLQHAFVAHVEVEPGLAQALEQLVAVG